MGTNFYLQTKNKALMKKYAPETYYLVDTPYYGYQLHIAKTSSGWLPLFQAHGDTIRSVAIYKEMYDTNEFEIYDEYNEKYTWEQFTERVLTFNGGILGKEKPKKVEPLTEEMIKHHLVDANMPEYTPVTHLPGSKQSYKNIEFLSDTIFADPEGYEFDEREFW